jgi:beta-lactamase class A
LVTRRSHAQTAKWRWWWLGLLGMVVVAAGIAWGVWQHGQHLQLAVKPAPAVSRTSQSQRASVASTPKTPALPTTQVKTLAQATVLAVAGTNSVYVAKLGTSGEFVANNAPQRAASDIKLFIMATVFHQVAAGKLDLAKNYTMTAADKVGGSGVMQGFAPGTTVPLRQVVQYMMDDSDNVASNIMVAQVGGLAAVNAESKRIGATDTVMARKLMDTQALAAGHDNLTSVKDLGLLLTKLYQHRLVSPEADEQMLALLAQNKNHTKLPAQVTDAKVYNKTGEFGDYGVQNDAAIMTNAHGTMVVVVLAQGGAEQAQIQAQSNFGVKLAALLLA